MLGKQNVYFLEGYAQAPSGHLEQSSKVTILDPHEPVLKWAYEQIKDVRQGRYLLQDRAIEIFSVEGNNTLLALKDKSRRDFVCEKILPLVPQDGASSGERIPGVDNPTPRAERDFLGLGLSALPGFGSRTVTQRWENGEITNFQYLMYLNTMAGRSYNDLNQYPVFPWVLANYDSDMLDLDDPCTYRDLGKPMGAQTPQRAAGFAQRFETWEVRLDEGKVGFPGKC